MSTDAVKPKPFKTRKIGENEYKIELWDGLKCALFEEHLLEIAMVPIACFLSGSKPGVPTDQDGYAMGAAHLRGAIGGTKLIGLMMECFKGTTFVRRGSAYFPLVVSYDLTEPSCEGLFNDVYRANSHEMYEVWRFFLEVNFPVFFSKILAIAADPLRTFKAVGASLAIVNAARTSNVEKLKHEHSQLMGLAESILSNATSTMMETSSQPTTTDSPDDTSGEG